MASYQQSPYGYYNGPPQSAFSSGPPPGYVATFDSNQYHQSINPAMIHQPMSMTATAYPSQHIPSPQSFVPNNAQQSIPYYYGETGIVYQPGPSMAEPSHGHTYRTPSPLQPALPPGMNGHNNGHGNGASHTQIQYNHDNSQVNGSIGRWKPDTKEGPVKNACLSCRSKKAKCDGLQPVCGQVCLAPVQRLRPSRQC